MQHHLNEDQLRRFKVAEHLGNVAREHLSTLNELGVVSYLPKNEKSFVIGHMKLMLVAQDYAKVITVDICAHEDDPPQRKMRIIKFITDTNRCADEMVAIIKEAFPNWEPDTTIL